LSSSRALAFACVTTLVIPASANADDDRKVVLGRGQSSGKSVYVGVDVGVGVPAGGSALFGPGLGRAFIVGYRQGAWSLELRPDERYDLSTDGAVGAPLEATLGITGAAVGWRPRLGGRVVATFAAGPAVASASLVATDADGVVVVVDRSGAGVGVGAGVATALSARVELVVDGRAYFVRWEHAGSMVIHDLDDSGVPVRGIDPLGGVPFSVAAGLRYRL